MEANGSTVAPVAAVPPSIVKAICTIMATMEAVKKTNRNQHGSYMFASTDDIYAALTRKMGEVGLICIPLEEHMPEITRVEKDGKTSQWAKFTFAFVLATEEGTWTDARSRRTLFIQVNGPQTFQAAQSYCEKAYLKSLFKLPTGDMDLDGFAQAETEEDQVTLNAAGPRKRKSSAASKRDGTDKVFNDILSQIESAPNAEFLQQINVLYAAEIREMPEKWSSLLNDHYEDKMAALREASM